VSGIASAIASSADVSLPGQPASLAGTLTTPDGTRRVPGVLIIAGSGPTDRNGNQPGMLNDAYRKVADGLAACGIATLRTDKRGIALSAAAEPDESNLTIETYVRDTLAWLDWLRAQPRIGDVSLLGHSEGALIASIAAQRTPVAHLVLLAGSGRRAGEVLRDQLQTLGMAAVLRRRADRMITLLESGDTDDEPPAGLSMLFRPGVQRYLISWFRLDPVAELARTTIPVLVVQGTTDLQVGVGDARALAAARPGVRLHLIAGMNHVLRTAPADPSANFATYTDTGLPLAPDLLPALCAFLRP
jgi:pimeloyl-ACP methyl ester carboxylesterase